MSTQLIIPRHFYEVRYNPDIYPGLPHRTDLADGANCQVFAYSLLAYFGIDFPPLRSSELWADRYHSKIADTLEPLDLLLFGRTSNAFGAHVALYIEDGRAIHLSQAIGLPVEWRLDEFTGRPEYGVFIGAKRAIAAVHKS